MKRSFKFTLVLLACAICATVLLLFAGCTNLEDYYNDLQKMVECGSERGKDYDHEDGGYCRFTAVDTGYKCVAEYTQFSGVKTIRTIKMNTGADDDICLIEFSDLRVTSGEFKIILVKGNEYNADSAVYDFDEIFDASHSGLLCSWALTRLTTYQGDVDVKIVGKNATFHFETDVYTRSAVEGDGTENPPDNPDNPDNPPDNPPPSTDGAKIKAAYESAGYDVDLTADDLDPSIASAVSALQTAYEQLGYGICYIGRNLDSANFELYMVISADTEDAAKELAQGLSAYKNAQKGANVIVSVNLMLANPNFEPFNQAI